jgi:2-polyprenyl-3-methyl-5-hydroxy-6-metoxy-1,4-benzoquinol methylase
MKRHLIQWHRLGTYDPYWAVLPYADKRGGQWDRAEFFATGEAEVENTFARLQALHLTARPGRALDFGCGVGRLTRALARRFSNVVGVDISAPMLAEARAAGQLSNIEFILNQRSDLNTLDSDSFDFIYSNVVLQHMIPKLQVGYIQEFCRFGISNPFTSEIFHLAGLFASASAEFCA